jgi:hypothetical protein
VTVATRAVLPPGPASKPLTAATSRRARDGCGSALSKPVGVISSFASGFRTVAASAKPPTMTAGFGATLGTTAAAGGGGAGASRSTRGAGRGAGGAGVFTTAGTSTALGASRMGRGSTRTGTGGGGG